MEQLSKLRDEYVNNVIEIAAYYQLVWKGNPMTPSVMRILSRYPCELRADYELTHLLESPKERFDAYFAEKHHFAQMRLVERLKNALTQRGYAVLVSIESGNAFGRHDVEIRMIGSTIEVTNHRKKIVVEIKTGQSVNFEQIERYLWEGTNVILCRIVLGHVSLLKAEDCSYSLSQGLSDYIQKASRMLRREPILVAGPDCLACPLNCTYARSSSAIARKMISLKGEDFQGDSENFMRNLAICLDKVTAYALSEIDGGLLPSG